MRGKKQETAKRLGVRQNDRTADVDILDVYILLEITPEEVDKLPKISHLTRAVGNAHKLLEYLSASEAEEAIAVVEASRRLTYDMLCHTPLEFLCACAKVSTKRIFGILSEEVMEQGEKATKLLAQAMHPKVVEKTIEVALEDDGSAERKMLLQASGFLPSAQKHVTQFFGRTEIDARNQVNQTAVLPPVEESVRRLSDRFLMRDTPALPPPEEIVEGEEAGEEAGE